MQNALDNLAFWAVGVAVSFIILIILVRSGVALKESAYQKLAIVVVVGIILIGLGTLTKDQWKGLGSDFVTNVLKIKTQ